MTPEIDGVYISSYQNAAPTKTWRFLLKDQLMSFSKFGFQTGPEGGVTGVGDMIARLTAAGIPMCAAASDSANVIYDLQQSRKQSGVPHQMNYIRTEDQYGRFDFDLRIHPDAETAYEAWAANAAWVWDRVEATFPPELDRSIVTVSIENEQRPYVGWCSKNAPIGEPECNQKIPGFTGWADCFGAQAKLRAIEAERRGFRYRAFAYAMGNPDEGAWEQPGMLEYLVYCAKTDGRQGIALHEYSGTLNLMDGFGEKLGRFEQLLRACDNHKIPYPQIFIKEFGWAERNAPGADEAMRQLAEVADTYAAYPCVEGLALWTTAVGWSGLNDKIVALVQPLTDFALSYRYTGELITGPSEAPDGGAMLRNGSFEEGWTDVLPAPDRIQQPNGWGTEVLVPGSKSRFYNSKTGEFPEITGIPECTHKPNSMLPADEQIGGVNALVLHGDYTWKMMQAVNMVAGVANGQWIGGLLPHQRFRFTVPMQVHYHSVLNEDSPDDTQVMITCGSERKLFRAIPDLPDRKWVYLVVEGEADASGDLYIEVAAGTVWRNSRDVFIDALKLELIDQPQPPDNCDGAPREQYKRVYWVVPAGMSPSDKEYIYSAAADEDRTVGPSYDDGGIGALVDKTAVLWGIPDPEKATYTDWYKTNYPGTKVEFREVPPSGGGFRPEVIYRPSQETRLTQAFGENPQNYPMWGNCGHEGIDVGVPLGNPYYAVASGKVVHASNKRWGGDGESDYGYNVVIRHNDNGRIWHSHYAHAAQNLPVVVDQFVGAGQIVGYSGNTGRSTGAHLHFSILITEAEGCHPQTMYGYFINPVYVLVEPAPPLDQGYAYNGPAVTYADAIHAPADDWRWPVAAEMVDRLGIAVKFLSNGISPDYYARYAERPFHLVRLFRNFSQTVPWQDAYNDWRGEVERFWNRGARKFEVHNEPNLPNEGLGVNWNDGAGFGSYMKPILSGLLNDFPGIQLYFPGMSPGVPWTNQFSLTDPAWQTLRPYCYGFCMHAYTGDNNSSNAEAAANEIVWQVVELQKRMNLQVPLVVSESSVNRGTDYTQKADVYGRVNAKLNQVRGVEACVWFISDWFSPPPEQAGHGESWYGTPMLELYRPFRKG